MSKNTITYIIIAILLLVGGYWAYGMFSGSGKTTATGGVTITGGAGKAPVDEATAQANQFIQILQNVNQVTLSDLSLLNSPIFQTGLQDFGKPIEDRPVGRPNPFAPVTGLDFIPEKGTVATSTPKTTGPATTTPGPLVQ